MTLHAQQLAVDGKDDAIVESQKRAAFLHLDPCIHSASAVKCEIPSLVDMLLSFITIHEGMAIGHARTNALTSIASCNPFVIYQCENLLIGMPTNF